MATATIDPEAQEAPPVNGAVPSPSDDEQQPDAGRRWGRRLIIWVLAVVIIAGILWWGIPYLLHSLAWTSTDDAFLEADIHTISAQVAGRVARVHVEDNVQVEAGALLVELQPEDFDTAVASEEAAVAAAEGRLSAANAQLDLARTTADADVSSAQAQVALAEAQVAAARANVTAAQADLQRQQADLTRYEQLHASESITEQQYEHARLEAESAQAKLDAARQQVQEMTARVDAARAQLAVAQAGPTRVQLREAERAAAAAQLREAQADLDQAKLDAGYTKIYAPTAGRVAQKHVQTGEYVQPGQALMAIVDPDVWVRANFKETQLGAIRPGLPAVIHVDAYPDAEFAGHVESIQRGTGSVFSLLPPQNATGNYVKVVQRLPVKIVFDAIPEGFDGVLAPGMSVVPEVRVQDEDAAPSATTAARQ